MLRIAGGIILAILILAVLGAMIDAFYSFLNNRGR